jgi:uncharacterized protein involved in exopolysaccharide biosynthesis
MAQFELPIPNITARDVLRVVFKQKWPIIGLYCFIVIVSALACFFWPPTYEASVRFLLTHKREEPIISSDQASVRMLTPQVVTEQDLNSEMEIIQSPAVIEKTVKDMKIDTLPEPWYIRLLNAPMNAIRHVYDSYHSKPYPSPLVRGVERLATKVQITPEKQSHIIDVHLRWGDPRFAQSTLESLTSNYLAQHLLIHKGPNTTDLFLDQLNLKKAQLAKVEEEMERIRPGGSVDSVEQERELAMKAASDFEAGWRRARASSRGDQARIDSASTQLQATPPRLLTSDKDVVNQQAIGALRSQVLQLQLKRTELLQKFQPQNRLVLQIEEELKEAEEVLNQVLNNPPHEQTTDINKVAEDLRQKESVSQTDLRSNQALETAMKEEYGEYEERIHTLDRQAMQIELLDRQKKALVSSLLLYEKEYDQARLQDAMNLTGIINVVPIESPWANLSPVKPNSSLLMKLAFGLGLLVAVSFGFLLELLDHRLKSDSDAEFHLGVPVLATLDQYDSEEVPQVANA